MSIIPEYIIQQALVRGMRSFREDGRLLDILFHNLTQTEQEAIRDFFREKTIDLCLNYPSQDLKLPAIVLLLKSEVEAPNQFLGNLVQDQFSIEESEPLPFMLRQPQAPATVVGAGSEGPVWGEGEIVFDPVIAVLGGPDYVDIPEGTITEIDPFEYDVWLEILEGTGAGQKRQIISVAGVDPRTTGLPVRITVSPVWVTEPDDTSIVQIVNPHDSEGVTGEPSKVFDENTILERRGSIYSSAYQLLVLAPNPEMTIFIYAVVKAIMFLNHSFLVKQGLMNLKLSGSDFMPRSEFLPSLAYQRALTMEFDYHFDVYTDISDQAINQLVISIVGHHPDDTQPGVEKELIQTTLDLT